MTTWGLGDYPRMAQRLEPAARLAVEQAAVSASDRVLDVGCGTGNAALLAAVAGARVVGVDFEPALLGIAQERAAAVGVAVSWQQADVVSLPFPDGSFTVAISVFGVMYASDQARAAFELRRVLAPGGRLVLASWIPGSFMPAMGGALAGYLPPPRQGGAPPARWGGEYALQQLLADAEIDLQDAAERQLTLTFSDTEEATGFLIETAGHVLAERERLEREGRWQNLLDDMRTLVEERNTASDGTVSLRLDYLLARGRSA